MYFLILSTLVSAMPETNKVERSITVSGDSEVCVAPNTVRLTVTVISIDKNLSKAKALNDERLKRVIAALTKIVESKNIQSDNVSISQRRNSESYNKDVPDAYEVSRSTVVTLKDVKRFEELLTSSLEAGASEVGGIDFRTTDLRKHRDTARSMAMKAAHEKAVALATEAGMKVGKPRNISEQFTGGGYWSAGSRGGGYLQNSSQNVGISGESAESGLAPGMIAVTASVSVTYDLE
jgi:uncharacterized protein